MKTLMIALISLSGVAFAQETPALFCRPYGKPMLLGRWNIEIYQERTPVARFVYQKNTSPFIEPNIVELEDAEIIESKDRKSLTLSSAALGMKIYKKKRGNRAYCDGVRDCWQSKLIHLEVREDIGPKSTGQLLDHGWICVNEL